GSAAPRRTGGGSHTPGGSNSGWSRSGGSGSRGLRRPEAIRLGTGRGVGRTWRSVAGGEAEDCGSPSISFTQSGDRVSVGAAGLVGDSSETCSTGGGGGLDSG